MQYRTFGTRDYIRHNQRELCHITTSAHSTKPKYQCRANSVPLHMVESYALCSVKSGQKIVKWLNFFANNFQSWATNEGRCTRHHDSRMTHMYTQTYKLKTHHIPNTVEPSLLPKASLSQLSVHFIQTHCMLSHICSLHLLQVPLHSLTTGNRRLSWAVLFMKQHLHAHTHTRAHTHTHKHTHIPHTSTPITWLIQELTVCFAYQQLRPSKWVQVSVVAQVCAGNWKRNAREILNNETSKSMKGTV